MILVFFNSFYNINGQTIEKRAAESLFIFEIMLKIS